MPAPRVLRDNRNGIAMLTLNQPDKINAPTPLVFVELRAHLDALADNGPMRCARRARADRSVLVMIERQSPTMSPHRAGASNPRP